MSAFGELERSQSLAVSQIAFTDLSERQKAWISIQRDQSNVLAVGAQEPLIEVADKAEAENAYLIVIFDGNDVKGIISPKFVAERLSEIVGSSLPFLSAARSIQQMPGFHANLLNFGFISPDFVWCSLGGHYTDSVPCREHPG
jgi:hypothetical protein